MTPDLARLRGQELRAKRVPVLLLSGLLGEKDTRIVVYLWLALGGAIGTIGRYAVSGWVVDRFGPTPLGTFVVNIVGALIIGFVIVLLENRFLAPAGLRPFLAIGMLGGFTTFSTFSFETMSLIQEGALGTAALNAFGSLACGLIAVWIGMTLARLV